VIEVDVEVAHDLPLHEDVREMNGREQSAGTLEHVVLRTLNVNLHDSLTEGHDVDKVIKDDGADDDWTRSSALSYLDTRHVRAMTHWTCSVHSRTYDNRHTRRHVRAMTHWTCSTVHSRT